MRCSKCGFENPEGAVFCAKCGGKLETAEREAKGGIGGLGASGTSRLGEEGKGFSPKSGHAAKPSVTRTLETTPEGLGKGELFAGRFELIEELGAGGMGIVYRAYDKEVGRGDRPQGPPPGYRGR